ncbi:MAG: hypothetical protein O3A48_01020 [Actinomycetota bacterium]|nr:hypothetical protein [Actinomycetota bacterium]MDA3013106.1 hypothetical protein [Actinomycetota bacterium]
MKKTFSYLLIAILAGALSIFVSSYYQKFTEQQEFNSFLEKAGLVSSLHNDASEKFKTVLDFSEVSREDFELTLDQIITNSKEAYNLINNIDSKTTTKEQELLHIATIHWLKGIELFEVSIISLIDNPNSEKIQESIAQSIADFSVGDRAYDEFLFLIKQNSSDEGTFLPVLYTIEYVGIEDNSYRFADLLVDKAQSGSGGLFLRRNLAISGAEFKPNPLARTEEGYSVLQNDKVELQIVLTNEGNVDAYDVVILVLVTDEFGDTVHEQQAKINSIGPQESRIFYSDAIDIEPGVVHEWFIKLEELEKEENLNDNLFEVFGFIPPES